MVCAPYQKELEHWSAIHGSFGSFDSFLYGRSLFFSRLCFFLFKLTFHCIDCVNKKYGTSYEHKQNHLVSFENHDSFKKYILFRTLSLQTPELEQKMFVWVLPLFKICPRNLCSRLKTSPCSP
jgi:hypothetical protein